MKRARNVKTTLRLVLAAGVVLAVGMGAAATEQTAAEEDTLRAELTRLLPELPIYTVAESAIAGVYAVQLEDGAMLYVSGDGSHAIAGDMYALTDAGPVNLAEGQRAKRRRELIAGVDVADMIVFAPRAKPSAVLHVFTDVDCGYCRKLHNERQALREHGIELRYLAYPRAGVGSPTYNHMVSAWCADDRQGAITHLKQGEAITDRTCDNPVAAQYELGGMVGVSGTPSIITAAGELIPGYMPADELAKKLGVL